MLLLEQELMEVAVLPAGKLQFNHHYQDTNTAFLQALPAVQPTVSLH